MPEQDPDRNGRSASDASLGGSAEAPTTRKTKEEKDFWDKLSSISTFLSTVLIALVGAIFTYVFNAREAKHQHSIQETQTVAQLMQFLTSKDEKQQRTALIAIKVLQDANLMVDLAASDPTSPGARKALRDVAFNAPEKKDRAIARDTLRQFEFVSPCSLPFVGPPVTHPIDDSPEYSCGMFGRSDSPDALKAQDFAKNNFCAGTRNGHPEDEPELVDFDKLNQLQSQVAHDPRINFGDLNNATADRTLLAKIGEGKLVTMRGYVLRAMQEGPESVNCGPNVPDQPDNHDIHIVLVPSAGEMDECKAVVAEISPHHRPLEWTAPNINALAVSKALVRVSGQLFFDSSHQPCKNGERNAWHPKRSSLWEIHPIYGIKVCISDCEREGQWEELKRSPQG